jgi:hypothetical protein
MPRGLSSPRGVGLAKRETPIGGKGGIAEGMNAAALPHAKLMKAIGTIARASRPWSAAPDSRRPAYFDAGSWRQHGSHSRRRGAGHTLP